MVYNFKEYKTSFETPAKKIQEFTVATKIMDLLNKNKYNNLEEFVRKNDNYQDFLKNNNMDTVMKHFDNTTLTEVDFKMIIENLKILTANNQDLKNEKDEDILKEDNSVKSQEIHEKTITQQKRLTLTPNKIYNEN